MSHLRLIPQIRGNGGSKIRGESGSRGRKQEARGKIKAQYLALCLVSCFWSLASWTVGIAFVPNPSANLVSVVKRGGMKMAKLIRPSPSMVKTKKW